MGGDAMIGQSTINVMNGARGRLSGAVAAVAMLCFILALSPVIELVPVGTLTGVLFVVVGVQVEELVDCLDLVREFVIGAVVLCHQGCDVTEDGRRSDAAHQEDEEADESEDEYADATPMPMSLFITPENFYYEDDLTNSIMNDDTLDNDDAVMVLSLIHI